MLDQLDLDVVLLQVELLVLIERGIEKAYGKDNAKLTGITTTTTTTTTTYIYTLTNDYHMNITLE